MKHRLGLRSTGVYILESGETLNFWDPRATPVKNDTQEVHYSQVKT